MSSSSYPPGFSVYFNYYLILLNLTAEILTYLYEFIVLDFIGFLLLLFENFDDNLNAD